MLPVESAYARALFASITVAIVAIAVIGGIRTFSPVPWADMWDGGLEFLLRATRGDRDVWWAQHNEHRIVLARLLFWVDFKFFGGMSRFLIAANYLFVFASAALFCKMLRDLSGPGRADTGEFIVGCLITAWLFQWMQAQNFTWAFQSQFFLAQLLPLAALYVLSRAATEAGVLNFSLAAALGIASVGSMANGVLVLPLMALFALVTGMGWARTAVLGLLSAVTLYLYFHQFVAPGSHGSLGQALRDDPLGLAQYVLLYLGSPFYYLLRQGWLGRGLAMSAGAVLIVSAAALTFRALRSARSAPLRLALLVYVLYIGATALGTAGGRLILGIDQSLSGRYTTPALMVWAVLVLLNLDRVFRLLHARGTWCVTPLAVLMLVQQVHALRHSGDFAFERNLSTLAISLGVNDQAAIRTVFPAPSVAQRIGEEAIARDASVFGHYPFKDLRERLGSDVAYDAQTRCHGWLDGIEPIPDESRFVKVRGWIYDDLSPDSAELIQFFGENGKTIGFAMPGHPRPDVAKAVGKAARRSGFIGYMLAPQSQEAIGIGTDSAACFFTARIPRFPSSDLNRDRPVFALPFGPAQRMMGAQGLRSDPT